MGHDLTIYNRRGEKKFNLFSRANVSTVTRASQKTTLLADDTITISATSAKPLDLTIGDYLIVFGKRYKFNQLPQPTKAGERVYSYEMTLEGLQYDLIDAHYHLPEDAYGETYYANLPRHLEILAWNINRIHSGWTVQADADAYDPDDYQNITATQKNCLAMLQELCSLFKVEFEITAKGSGGVVRVRKKAGITHPFTLRYGRGRGLYQLARTNVNNAGITNRLYVYGSQENLPKNYGHNRLCLAETSRLTSYIEDAASIEAYGVKEDEKTYPDIKAERIGKITALGEDRLTFIDNSGSSSDPQNPPMFDLNEKDKDGNTLWLIPDTTAKITFQTGNLAGYEFDLKSYDHTAKKFKIIRFQDENGLAIPNDEQDAFSFGVGDKYIITNIQLPDAYVKMAQAKLEAAARADFPAMTQPQVSYKLGLAEDFFKATFGTQTETEVLHVGDYIHIIDKEIGVDKEVRITAITRDLLRPHSYELTLSDTVTKSSIVKIINDISDIQDAISYNSGFTDPGKARRRWLATQELLNMVFDPEGDYYSEKIKPLSIETQMLSVGAKSTQFTLNNVTIQPNYNGSPAAINFSAGLLVHYGINPDAPRIWAMMAATHSGLMSTAAYYIYARCPREAGNGTFFLSTTPITCEGDANYYYFLVGVLNSVSTDQHGGNAARLISLTYGSSTINGRFVRCGRIESSGGGATYFDLDTGVISGRILFRSSDGTVTDVAELEDKTAELEDYINNALQGTLEGLQGQLDGVIEQWFYEVDPADTKAPTVDWITAGTSEQDKHLGDLYYNTKTGKVWRYVKQTEASGTGKPRDVYKWVELEDTELAMALKLAQDALDAADDKARIFYTTPYAPYDPGDLWVQGATGDILICIKERPANSKPSFSSSEWKKASKYTDDSALNNFIGNQYQSDIADILNQVDGKIECWYTTSNPANAWDIKDYEAHLGDQWYDTANKKLYRWTSSDWLYANGQWIAAGIIGGVGVIQDATNHKTWFWSRIQDADAIAAAAAAAAAQETADGKCTVFTAQPKGPYYVGDLWLKGIDAAGIATEGLWRCIKDNTVAGSFNVIDWVEATYYDCTQTAIDGGIVTAGTVQLANQFTSSIVAGITGGYGKTWKETATTPESEKVRIWAGASEGNRRSAPFRVLQNGKVIASNADIAGKITSKEGEIGGWKLAAGTLKSSDKDDAGNDITPAITLDAEAGEIRAADSVVMDADGFGLLHNGYAMVRVANVSVGQYSENMLRQTYDCKSSPQTVTQYEQNGYIPHTGTYTWNPYKAVEIPLGYFERGSVIELGTFSIYLTVPGKVESTAHTVTLSIGAMRISLKRNGAVVKSWTTGGAGGVSNGKNIETKYACNTTYNVGAGQHGDYSILIESINQWSWNASNSGQLKPFTIYTTAGYKYTRGNHQRTLLGYDGLVSTWGSGVMFLNEEGFIVKFGNYAMRVTSSGLQKSTNGGSTWTSL